MLILKTLLKVFFHIIDNSLAVFSSGGGIFPISRTPSDICYHITTTTCIDVPLLSFPPLKYALL